METHASLGEGSNNRSIPDGSKNDPKITFWLPSSKKHFLEDVKDEISDNKSIKPHKRGKLEGEFEAREQEYLQQEKKDYTKIPKLEELRDLASNICEEQTALLPDFLKKRNILYQDIQEHQEKLLIVQKEILEYNQKIQVRREKKGQNLFQNSASGWQFPLLPSQPIEGNTVPEAQLLAQKTNAEKTLNSMGEINREKQRKISALCQQIEFCKKEAERWYNRSVQYEKEKRTILIIKLRTEKDDLNNFLSALKTIECNLHSTTLEIGQQIAAANSLLQSVKPNGEQNELHSNAPKKVEQEYRLQTAVNQAKEARDEYIRRKAKIVSKHKEQVALLKDERKKKQEEVAREKEKITRKISQCEQQQKFIDDYSDEIKRLKEKTQYLDSRVIEDYNQESLVIEREFALAKYELAKKYYDPLLQATNDLAKAYNDLLSLSTKNLSALKTSWLHPLKTLTAGLEPFSQKIYEQDQACLKKGGVPEVRLADLQLDWTWQAKTNALSFTIGKVAEMLGVTTQETIPYTYPEGQLSRLSQEERKKYVELGQTIEKGKKNLAEITKSYSAKLKALQIRDDLVPLSLDERDDRREEKITTVTDERDRKRWECANAFSSAEWEINVVKSNCHSLDTDHQKREDADREFAKLKQSIYQRLCTIKPNLIPGSLTTPGQLEAYESLLRHLAANKPVGKDWRESLQTLNSWGKEEEKVIHQKMQEQRLAQTYLDKEKKYNDLLAQDKWARENEIAHKKSAYSQMRSSSEVDYKNRINVVGIVKNVFNDIKEIMVRTLREESEQELAKPILRAINARSNWLQTLLLSKAVSERALEEPDWKETLDQMVQNIERNDKESDELMTSLLQRINRPSFHQLWTDYQNRRKELMSKVTNLRDVLWQQSKPLREAKELEEEKTQAYTALEAENKKILERENYQILGIKSVLFSIAQPIMEQLKKLQKETISELNKTSENLVSLEERIRPFREAFDQVEDSRIKSCLLDPKNGIPEALDNLEAFHRSFQVSSVLEKNIVEGIESNLDSIRQRAACQLLRVEELQTELVQLKDDNEQLGKFIKAQIEEKKNPPNEDPMLELEEQINGDMMEKGENNEEISEKRRGKMKDY